MKRTTRNGTHEGRRRIRGGQRAGVTTQALRPTDRGVDHLAEGGGGAALTGGTECFGDEGKGRCGLPGQAGGKGTITKRAFGGLRQRKTQSVRRSPRWRPPEEGLTRRGPDPESDPKGGGETRGSGHVTRVGGAQYRDLLSRPERLVSLPLAMRSGGGPGCRKCRSGPGRRGPRQVSGLGVCLLRVGDARWRRHRAPAPSAD